MTPTKLRFLAIAALAITGPGRGFAAESATTAPHSGRHAVMLMALRAQGVDADTTRTIDGLIAVELSKVPELSVMSNADVKEIVGLEAQKGQLGCDSEDGSCLAEMAGAMGAEHVIFGQVGRLDRLLVINLNLYEARSARVVKRLTVQTENVSTVPTALQQPLRELIAPILGVQAPAAEVAANEQGGGIGWLPPALAIAGGVTAVAGAVALGIGLVPWFSYRAGLDQVNTIRREIGEMPNDEGIRRLAAAGAAAEEQRQAWNDWGSLTAIAGGGVAGVGVGVAAAGLAWWLLTPAAE